MADSIEEMNGFYRVIQLKNFRNTPGVSFDLFPLDILSRIDSIDRVLHQNGAVSPGPVLDIERPWYMHPYQDDNLIVVHGERMVELFSPEYRATEKFIVKPDAIYKNDALLYSGGAILVWPKGTFHRIISGKDGSASLNFAVHYKGYDILNNFNMYDLNVETGMYRMIREGFCDQM